MYGIQNVFAFLPQPLKILTVSLFFYFPLVPVSLVYKLSIGPSVLHSSLTVRLVVLLSFVQGSKAILDLALCCFVSSNGLLSSQPPAFVESFPLVVRLPRGGCYVLWLIGTLLFVRLWLSSSRLL